MKSVGIPRRRMRAPRDQGGCQGLSGLRKRCGPCWIRGSDAAMVPNWLGSEDGSGIKASVSAYCILRGCLAPHAILAMLGILRLMECNHEIDNDAVKVSATQSSL
jgi:hypothetical protein